MKICITSTEKSIDSPVDPRFGRCKYFIIAHTETLDFEAIENPNIQSQGGAGIKAGQFISSKKVDALLTGSVGTNAAETLGSAGIKVFTGISGTVKDAIEDFQEGKLKEAIYPA
jgi:predicted Fe-Mo cluster-binding NifX family protein